MKARFSLVVLCSIPMAFMIGRLLSQETLPKVGQEQSAETAKPEGKPLVIKGDCYLLAKAAKAARDKAATAHTSADEQQAKVNELKANLAAAEKSYGELAAAADEADKEASAAEAQARETIAQCLAKVRAAEEVLGGAKPRVKTVTKGEGQ